MKQLPCLQGGKFADSFATMTVQTGISVDLALVLAVDVSSSVDAGDYKMQMDGIASALRNPAVPLAIAQGTYKSIALSLVHWSSWKSQVQVVPWMLASTSADLEAIAVAVEGAERRWQPGGTGLAVAITYCTALVLALPLEASRRVIDVSGDGEDNEQGDVGLARDQAVERGVTINGLPILYGSSTLLSYYTRRVMGGEGAFIQPAASLRDFKDQMTLKLLREIGQFTT